MLGDVADVGDQAADGRVVEQVLAGRLGGHPPPVGVPGPGRDRQRRQRGRGEPDQQLGEDGGVVGVEELEGRPAHHFVGAVAEQAGDGLAGLANDPRRVEYQDRVGREADERPEPLLAQLEGGLGVRLRGDVDDRGELEPPAVGGDQPAGRGEHPDQPAVLPQHTPFAVAPGPAGQDLVVQCGGELPVLVREDQGELVAEEIFARVTTKAGERRVHPREQAVGVGHEHADCGRLEDEFEGVARLGGEPRKTAGTGVGASMDIAIVGDPHPGERTTYNCDFGVRVDIPLRYRGIGIDRGARSGDV